MEIVRTLDHLPDRRRRKQYNWIYCQ